MSYTIDPSRVQKFAFSGAAGADMGNIQDDEDPIRFGLATRYVLLWIKGRFTGGTSSATLQVKLRHHDRRGWLDKDTTPSGSDGMFDFVEVEVLTVGTDATANLDWRQVDEAHRYVYEAGDMLVPEWTNPNTQEWALEFGVLPLA